MLIPFLPNGDVELMYKIDGFILFLPNGDIE
jgi:hypothetical protein